MKKKDEIKKTKSAQELNEDSLENVSGGNVDYNELTNMWDVFDDDTNDLVKSFESESSAKICDEMHRAGKIDEAKKAKSQN